MAEIVLQQAVWSYWGQTVMSLWWFILWI